MIYLVEERLNPSSEYFVLPALQAQEEPILRCGFTERPAPGALRDATVVFTRYVPEGWRRQVAAERTTLRRLVLFLDDDLLDLRASAGLPWRYRAKLWRLTTRHRAWLQAAGAELWVSTPVLARKYAAWKPRLVLPCPLPALPPHCRVFYHGSAAHDAEIRWLRPVMEAVLRQEENLSFELIGGRAVHRLYRGLPRVIVVHPMKWPAYRLFNAIPGRTIGLAPLLPLPFNSSRSYTKFFDITQSGAVGVYTPGSAAAGIVQHGRDGWVVPLQPEAWVEAILHLARDLPLRTALLENAQRTLAQLQLPPSPP